MILSTIIFCSSAQSSHASSAPSSRPWDHGPGLLPIGKTTTRHHFQESSTLGTVDATRSQEAFVAVRPTTRTFRSCLLFSLHSFVAFSSRNSSPAFAIECPRLVDLLRPHLVQPVASHSFARFLRYEHKCISAAFTLPISVPCCCRPANHDHAQQCRCLTKTSSPNPNLYQP